MERGGGRGGGRVINGHTRRPPPSPSPSPSVAPLPTFPPPFPPFKSSRTARPWLSAVCERQSHIPRRLVAWWCPLPAARRHGPASRVAHCAGEGVRGGTLAVPATPDPTAVPYGCRTPPFAPTWTGGGETREPTVVGERRRAGGQPAWVLAALSRAHRPCRRPPPSPPRRRPYHT